MFGVSGLGLRIFRVQGLVFRLDGALRFEGIWSSRFELGILLGQSPTQ